MKKAKLFFEVLRLPLDFLASMSAFLLAYHIRPLTDLIPGVEYSFFPEQLPPFPEFFKFSLIATVFMIVLFTLNGLYSIKTVERFGKTFLRIIFLISAWLMFIIAYYFLVVHELFFSRIALAHIWLFSIVFVTSGRILVLLVQELLYHLGFLQTRVLFIGVNALADRCFNVLRQDKKYKVIGTLAESHFSRKKGALPVIGTVNQLEQLIHKYQVEEIIQAEPSLNTISNAELLSFCRSYQIHYYFIPEVLMLQSVNVEMEMIDNIPIISLKQTPLEGWGYICKRLFDMVFSFIIIILLTPFWVIIPILIKLDSPGPAFYRSRRKHKNTIFDIFKFRSMIMDADKQKASLLLKNERTGPLFKIKDDPRVTRLGRFLRKTSIDELPQLFNVFAGTLSLVGPRPHLPEEVDQYESEHRKLFTIKPGVTGLAQINGRSTLSFDDEVTLDFYYIENWSMWLDFKIILKSILVMLKADGH